MVEGGCGTAEANTTTGEGDTNTALLAENTVAMPEQQAEAAVENKF